MSIHRIHRSIRWECVAPPSTTKGRLFPLFHHPATGATKDSLETQMGIAQTAGITLPISAAGRSLPATLRIPAFHSFIAPVWKLLPPPPVTPLLPPQVTPQRPRTLLLPQRHSPRRPQIPPQRRSPPVQPPQLSLPPTHPLQLVLLLPLVPLPQQSPQPLLS